MDDYVGVNEAATALNTSTESVRRYCLTGLLDHIKTAGGHRRISRESLNSLIQARQRLSSTVTIIGGA